MSDLTALVTELRRCAGWEDTSGALRAAERIAALDSDDAVVALIPHVVGLDDIDLTDDAGDVADELWRLGHALAHGLERCGPRAIPRLRPLLARRNRAGLVALRVLAALRDPEAAQVAEDWVRAGEPSAIVPLGLLAPPGACELLARTVAETDDSWTKRLAAHALGKLGSDAAVDALERMLDDADWYARLGVAEALHDIDTPRARELLGRASRDPDARVAQAAR